MRAIPQTTVFLAASLVLLATASLPAEEPIRNLALNRAAYASTCGAFYMWNVPGFIDTGHMATDGRLETVWRSTDGGPQWIYVDLGAECTIEKVVLRWDRFHAEAYKLQISNDAGPSARTGFVENWTDVHQATDRPNGVEEIVLPKPVKARFVRVYCTRQGFDHGFAPRFHNFTLREFEVYGTGGPLPTVQPPPPPAKDGTWDLSGGWRLKSDDYLMDDAAKISSCGYDDHAWLPAIVPGTVLTSYLAAGAIPDMLYGDYQFQVSDWFCRTNWWYRTELQMPQDYRGKRVWLNLDGINHKADVFVNGQVAGRLSGAFLRGRFDVTDKVLPGRKNCIAVLIHPMPHVLEPTVKQLDKLLWADRFTPNTPTFVESGEWDWIPTIRDRNIGIWNRVSLSTSGDVTIRHPFVITDLPLLPDVSRADLTVKAEVCNNSDRRQSGTLRGKIGDAEFSRTITLEPRRDVASRDRQEPTAFALDPESKALVAQRLWPAKPLRFLAPLRAGRGGRLGCENGRNRHPQV